MKKVKIVALLFLLGILILVLTGCGENKTAITADKFRSYMESKNYRVFSSFLADENTSEALEATNNTWDFEMYFFAYNDLEKAKKDFKQSKSIFENIEKNSRTNLNIDFKSSGNYSKFSLVTAEDKYCIVSRIDNTIIQFVGDIKDKETIDNILSELGY